MALARRLNELAVANQDGLLKFVFIFSQIDRIFLIFFNSDDEYRLLRQNVFEQYSSSTTVPTESPIVPVSGSRHRVSPFLFSPPSAYRVQHLIRRPQIRTSPPSMASILPTRQPGSRPPCRLALPTSLDAQPVVRLRHVLKRSPPKILASQLFIRCLSILLSEVRAFPVF